MSHPLWGPETTSIYHSANNDSRPDRNSSLWDNLGFSFPLNRTYVWIDKNRNLVGRLSWAATDITVASCIQAARLLLSRFDNSAANGGHCQRFGRVPRISLPLCGIGLRNGACPARYDFREDHCGAGLMRKKTQAGFYVDRGDDRFGRQHGSDSAGHCVMFHAFDWYAEIQSQIALIAKSAAGRSISSATAPNRPSRNGNAKPYLYGNARPQRGARRHTPVELCVAISEQQSHRERRLRCEHDGDLQRRTACLCQIALD